MLFSGAGGPFLPIHQKMLAKPLKQREPFPQELCIHQVFKEVVISSYAASSLPSTVVCTYQEGRFR